MRRCTTAVAAAIIALATGCSRGTVDGTPTETDFFSGYELSNDQDSLDEKATRPSGYTYE